MSDVLLVLLAMAVAILVGFLANALASYHDRPIYDEFDRLMREAGMGPYDARLTSSLEEEYFERNPVCR